MKQKDKKNSTKQAAQEAPKKEPIRKIPMAIALIAFAMFLVLWTEVYKPVVDDDWNTAGTLIDSSKRVSDTVKGIKILDQGGKILQAQLRLHPYHARLWYLYGFYLAEKKAWDSAIICEKKAIELGAGGTVNQVEFVAADRLCFALSGKIHEMDQADTSAIFKLLESAQVKGFNNIDLLKLSCIIYTNFQSYDKAISHLNSYNAVRKDADMFYYTALNYIRKGDKENAIKNAKAAHEINPGHKANNVLIEELNRL